MIFSSRPCACFAPLVVLLIALVGCSETDDRIPDRIAAHGYHGGHTFSTSDDLNVELEFTLDEQRRRLVIYGQSSDSHEPVALATKDLRAKFESDGVVFETAFGAEPRHSEASGTSSRFALRIDDLPQQLLTADLFELTVWYPWEGKTHSAEMTHRNDHAHKYRHD